MRITNIHCDSILASKKKHFFFFANRPSRKWIAARIEGESRKFECESERRRDSRESDQVLQNSMFCESIRANLRNVGVRIACSLKFIYYGAKGLILGLSLGRVSSGGALQSYHPPSKTIAIHHSLLPDIRVFRSTKDCGSSNPQTCKVQRTSPKGNTE